MKKTFPLAFVLTVVLSWWPTASIGESGVTVSYLYHLSNFSGTVPYMWPKIRVDNTNREVYVISGDGVKVFNEMGMETYDFSRQTPLSSGHDFAVDEEGNIYVLFSDRNPVTGETAYSLDRCNYRIESQERIEITGLPPGLDRFTPDRIFYRNGLFYLGNLGTMQIVATDKKGSYKTGYNLTVALGLTEQDEDMNIADFFVDRDGSLLFTSAVAGKAYRLHPDGKVGVFGKRGSAPGRFGVPAGIVADSRGNYYVADRLRSVVIVFDNRFNFLTEFGFRGPRPENIIVPSNLTIDDRDRLYVSQLAKRGVSVFQISPGD